ncbi:MAG: Hsp33 family molecular chaperone HslO [Pseudomonadota bacterium]
MTDILSSETGNEIFRDQPLRFFLPQRAVRGRAVRLDAVLDEILAAHDYPVAIKLVLAEALVLATLLGSLLKSAGGQLTMQAQSGQAQSETGVISLLVVDYRAGQLRGYAQFDADRAAELGANASLETLFGTGYLAITFDRDEGEGRYQGIVPIEGDSLAAACQHYFFQSEQIPTLIKVAISADEDDCRGAGLLLQHLPDGEIGRERLHVRHDHPEWEHAAILAETLGHDELLDNSLSMEQLVWRLFHEEHEIRVEPGSMLSRGCRCTLERYREILERFSEADRSEMRDENGVIKVDCAFCSRIFEIHGL